MGPKASRRRIAMRERNPSTTGVWCEMRRPGRWGSLAIAAIFCACLVGLFLMRADVVTWRPGQFAPYDITARVNFQFLDDEALKEQIDFQREAAPHVYRQVAFDTWGSLQDDLLNLPDHVHGLQPNQLDPPYSDILDGAALTQLEQIRANTAEQQTYEDDVHQFITYAQQHLNEPAPLVVLNEDDWDRETRDTIGGKNRQVVLEPAAPDPSNPRPGPIYPERTVEAATHTVGSNIPDSVKARLEDYAKGVDLGLGPYIARIAAAKLSAHPNYVLDDAATADMKNKAADQVDPKLAVRNYPRNALIVNAGIISDSDWQKLKAENQAYFRELTNNPADYAKYLAGMFGISLVITILLGAYVARYQPRCVKNHTRGIALVGLLLAMLLLSELAGIGSSSLYIFGIAPTIIAAMILTIAYDQRFALGVATIHTVIVTIALNQDLSFFLTLWVGVAVSCYLLEDIRSRSKLIEVGGAAALAMIGVTAAVGAVQVEPIQFIAYNCLYTGAAGLFAGFIVLGILPFIERTFRITTSMTLLELADVSQPLLRRLALEAAGTYNHSLQVATLSEAAAESIGANSLLCRVGSYYHDIGKINKPDYFVENQLGGENRHLNLSPTLSLRIILSHVKDGVEMAKEYNLPTSILPIIQQHHGTTMVEYFYHQAVTQTNAESGQPVSDTEFRYPGPRPRSREAAIVMLCDAIESAARSMSEPTASRIESLVHDLALKRLHDGQFDESELTMRDLATLEQALCKALVGIYHGRIAYPSAAPPQPALDPAHVARLA
jgi:putative nucleotidyltransferase with HDIG domain